MAEVTTHPAAARTRTGAMDTVLAALAGALVGYASFTVLVTIVTALMAIAGRDLDITTRSWRELGFAGAVATGVFLFVGFLYGGYVAARMSRRPGILLGVATFGAGVAIAILTAVLVSVAADADQTDRLVGALRASGIPGSGGEWRQVGPLAALTTLVGMLAGALLGAAGGRRGDEIVEARLSTNA